MREHFVIRLEEAKKELADLVREYNRMAVDCYERGDLEGHDYWTERAFDHIDIRNDIARDIQKLKKAGA